QKLFDMMFGQDKATHLSRPSAILTDITLHWFLEREFASHGGNVGNVAIESSVRSWAAVSLLIPALIFQSVVRRRKFSSIAKAFDVEAHLVNTIEKRENRRDEVLG